MHKNFRFALSLFAAVILLSSCGKKAPKEAKYIPKDATFAFVVNPKSLEDKMKSGNLTLDSLMKKFQAQGDTLKVADKQRWEDFKNCGVSLEDNFFIFIVQKGSIQKGNSAVMNLMGTLKDEAKFEAFLKKQESFKDKVVTKGSNYSSIVDDNMTLSWNKEIVLATYYQEDYKARYDTAGNYQAPDKSATQADLKKEVERYFTQKESESVASIDAFNNMFKEKADGYMFGTSSGALAYLSATPFNMPKLQELLKDNYSTTTFNFEDGKVVAKSATYTNPMMTSILKKYAGPTVNIAAVEKFPAQNINGALLLAINPEMFSAILKELELGGMVDMFLGQQGLTSADIFKALKGEMNIVFGDFSMAMKEQSIPMPDGTVYKSNTEAPVYKMLVTATVGDKAAFAKLMDKAVESGAVVKENGNYVAGPLLKMANMYLHVDDKNFVLASDSATYAAYIAGTGKANISADVLDKMKGKASAGYLDINSIMKGVMPSIKNNMGNKMMSIVNGTLKDALFTANNFDGTTVKGEAELRMVNTKQNSLVSLVNMFSSMAMAAKEESRMYNAPVVDSVYTPKQ